MEIIGIPRTTAVGIRVATRTRAALRSAGHAVRECRVAFTDENGPKGGVDIRCIIDVGLARCAELHVAGRATSPALAFREAMRRLRQRLDRVIGANRDLARRPKKYFAAIRASGHAGS